MTRRIFWFLVFVVIAAVLLGGVAWFEYVFKPKMIAAYMAGNVPPPTAVATVKASGDDLGLAFEVLGYEVHGTTVPLARAKVRVRAASPAGIEFDRVVVTDTVVGDRGMSAAALASRVAREVLDILRPQFARKVRTWR